jgi:hypothetical protein
MKPKAGSGRRIAAPSTKPALWNTRLPMEWMDPMSWRLPSGKALAEFALQAGFLAPLMLSTPGLKRKKPAPAGKAQDAAAGPLPPPGVDARLREGPDAPRAFRETR